MLEDKSNPLHTPDSPDSTPGRSRSLLHIFADERDRWLAVLEQVESQNAYQVEKSSKLLQWIEQHLEAPVGDATGDEPSEPSENPAESAGGALPVISNLAVGIEFMTAELQAAKEQIAQLKRQRDQAQADATQEQLNQAHQANAQLQAEAAQIYQAQAQLQPILNLLHGEKRRLAPDEIAPGQTNQVGAHQAIHHLGAQNNAISTPATKEPKWMKPGRNHGDKWVISFPVVKELGKAIGATYQKVILQVLAERGDEIEAHHENHGLSKYHNRGKDVGQLPDLIQVQGYSAKSA